jgi:hypothetical protein
MMLTWVYGGGVVVHLILAVAWITYRRGDEAFGDVPLVILMAMVWPVTLPIVVGVLVGLYARRLRGPRT